MRVTTAEFVRAAGAVADRAPTEPVTTTTDGRDRLALLPAEEHARLRRRDRRAVLPEELTEAELAAVAAAEADARHAHLDGEARGWRP